MTEPLAPAPDWGAVWADVASRLTVHRAAGRGHLLTEDSVRLCTVLALEASGVAPARVLIEVAAPELAGGKVDLVVDAGAGAARTVVELKYPRSSRTGISPDTMTLGELLRDFLRVALLPAADRWVVQVLEHRLRDYLARRLDVRLATEAGVVFELTRDAVEDLPKTARDAIGGTPWRLPVSATCVLAAPVDATLSLFAYRVDLASAELVAAPLRSPEAPARQPTPGPFRPVRSAPGGRGGGARGEILEAVRALNARSGRAEVAVQEVVDELRRRGSGYAESTIRTMMTSHMCAQVHGPGIGSLDDLDRVGRGVYRLRARLDLGAGP